MSFGLEPEESKCQPPIIKEKQITADLFFPLQSWTYLLGTFHPSLRTQQRKGKQAQGSKRGKKEFLPGIILSFSVV